MLVMILFIVLMLCQVESSVEIFLEVFLKLLLKIWYVEVIFLAAFLILNLRGLEFRVQLRFR